MLKPCSHRSRAPLHAFAPNFGVQPRLHLTVNAPPAPNLASILEPRPEIEAFDG